MPTIQTLTNNQAKNWKLIQQLRMHAEKLLGAADPDLDLAAHVLDVAHTLFNESGFSYDAAAADLSGYEGIWLSHCSALYEALGGKLADAEQKLRIVLETAIQAKIPTENRVCIKANLAECLIKQGKMAEAAPLRRVVTRAMGPGWLDSTPQPLDNATAHLPIIEALRVYVVDMLRSDEPDVSSAWRLIKLMHRLLNKSSLEQTNPELILVPHCVALATAAEGNLFVAESMLRNIISRARADDPNDPALLGAFNEASQGFDIDDLTYLTFKVDLAAVLFRQDKFADAEPLLRAAVRQYAQTWAQRPYQTRPDLKASTAIAFADIVSLWNQTVDGMTSAAAAEVTPTVLVTIT
jgi:hypothetical protein